MPEAAPVAPVAPLPSTVTPPQVTATPESPKHEAPSVETKAKKAAAVEEEFLEYVVDGKPEKVAKSEALKRLSKAAFADKVTQQAREALKATKAKEAEWAKEREEQKALLEQDEEAYLRKMGRDPEALARKILERKLREQELTPEQREAEAMKAELAALKKQQEEQAKAAEAEKVAANAKQIQQLMESELLSAAKAAELPTNPETFQIIYRLVQDSFDAGFPVDAEWAPRIIDAAKQQIDESIASTTKAVLSGLDGDALEARLGAEVVDKLVANRLAKIRGKRPAPAATQSTEPKQSAPKYITEAEFREQARKLGVR